MPNEREVYIDGVKFTPQGTTVNPHPVMAVAIAMSRGKRLEMDYTDSKGVSTTRTVEPQMFLWKTGHLNILAWCTKRNGFRMFRISGIRYGYVLPQDSTHVNSNKEG